MKTTTVGLQKTQAWPLVLGLDWGGGPSLKYVLLRRLAGGKLRIETFGRIAVNADAPEAVYEISQSLHELALRERLLKRAKAVIGLGTERVLIKRESFPPLSPKELRQTVHFMVQKDLGREGEDVAVTFDLVPAGPDPSVQGNTQYLCLGVESAMAAERASVLASEGMVPHKILPNAYALGNLLQFLPEKRRSDTVCFLDIGAIRSMLVFFRNGRLDFHREIVIGGEDFTKAITGTIFHEGRAIQFTTKEAREFKLRHGYPLGFSEGMTFRGAPLPEVGAMMRPVMERLTGEIHRSVGFYKDKTGDRSISALYVLGGGGQLRHLAQVLTERLGIPAASLPLSKEIKIAGGLKQEEAFRARSLEYANALGLALETQKQVNLLPRVFAKVHAMAELQKNLALVAAVLLFGSILFSVTAYFDLAKLTRRKAGEEKRARVAASQAARFDKVQDMKSLFSGKINAIDSRILQDPAFIPCLRMVTQACPKSLSILTLRIEENPEAGGKEETGRRKSRSKAAPPKEEPKKAAAIPRILTIEAESKASVPDIHVSVAQFMLDLSKSGYLTDVNFQDEKIIPETDEYTFTIKATLNF